MKENLSHIVLTHLTLRGSIDLLNRIWFTVGRNLSRQSMKLSTIVFESQLYLSIRLRRLWARTPVAFAYFVLFLARDLRWWWRWRRWRRLAKHFDARHIVATVQLNWLLIMVLPIAMMSGHLFQDVKLVVQVTHSFSLFSKKRNLSGRRFDAFRYSWRAELFYSEYPPLYLALSLRAFDFVGSLPHSL